MSHPRRSRPMPPLKPAVFALVVLFATSYPATASWHQERPMVGTTIAAGDNWGSAVAILGNTAAVGAELADPAGNASGAVAIFERTVEAGEIWNEVELLPGLAAGDHFGAALALTGSQLLVGAPLADTAGTGAGSVYVFERGVDGWEPVQELTASDGDGGDSFGTALSAVGDFLVVGAKLADGAGDAAGAAYVFVRDGSGTWTEERRLLASDADIDDQFGFAVAIDPSSGSGGTVVVGALCDDDDGSNSGSAYVFERNAGGAGNWGETAKLTASDSTAGDRFGGAVAILGSTVAVGAMFHDGFAPDAGAAYVFERQQTEGGTTWAQDQKPAIGSIEPGDLLGSAVALFGNILLVGSEGNDEGEGRAMRFSRDAAGTWQAIQWHLTGGNQSGRFGARVAIDMDRILIGGPTDDRNGQDAGIAQLYSPRALFDSFESGDLSKWHHVVGLEQ